MKKRSSFGWIELILGIALIALAVFTFVKPDTAFVSFVIIYGLIAIFSGIADIVFYTRIERNLLFGRSTSLVVGILSILVGVLILFNLNAGAFVLSILFPIWILLHCLARLANLGFIRRIAGKGSFWWVLILNLIGIVIAVLLLLNPFASAFTLTYLIGFFLLLIGISCAIIAFSPLGAKWDQSDE